MNQVKMNTYKKYKNKIEQYEEILEQLSQIENLDEVNLTEIEITFKSGVDRDDEKLSLSIINEKEIEKVLKSIISVLEKRMNGISFREPKEVQTESIFKVNTDTGEIYDNN